MASYRWSSDEQRGSGRKEEEGEKEEESVKPTLAQPSPLFIGWEMRNGGGNPAHDRRSDTGEQISYVQLEML